MEMLVTFKMGRSNFLQAPLIDFIIISCCRWCVCVYVCVYHTMCVKFVLLQIFSIVWLKEIPNLMWYSTILICEVLPNDHQGFDIEKLTEIIKKIPCG